MTWGARFTGTKPGTIEASYRALWRGTLRTPENTLRAIVTEVGTMPYASRRRRTSGCMRAAIGAIAATRACIGCLF
ncbi:hypothetical protein EMIT0111MI5_110171 [Burkholderia sp. IT-111MI5]